MQSSNPLGLLPEGQALVSSKNGLKVRQSGLGRLSVLSDELLFFIFSSLLSPLDLIRLERTSKSFYAFCRQDVHFKQALLQSTRGQLNTWRGTWRETYVEHLRAPNKSKQNDMAPALSPVKVGLYSDFLFQPALCAGFDPNTIYTTPSFKASIPYIDARTLKTSADLPQGPCIIQHAMDDWAAFNPPPGQPQRKWTLSNLAERCPASRFRAEAVLSTLSNYATYARNCFTEDTPAYLFDSEFCSKAAKENVDFEQDFKVPQYFSSDLFKVLQHQRPDYRWLIIGPAQAGSTFHKVNTFSYYYFFCKSAHVDIPGP